MVQTLFIRLVVVFHSGYLEHVSPNLKPQDYPQALCVSKTGTESLVQNVPASKALVLYYLDLPRNKGLVIWPLVYVANFIY